MSGAYWSRDAAALAKELGTPDAGLDSHIALERLQRDGPNAIAAETGTHPGRLLTRQFASPLVLILVFGGAVSLFLRDWVEAAIILVIGSSVLGFVQEYRAGTAVATLRRRLALTVHVVREGAERTVPSSEIVAGDDRSGNKTGEERSMDEKAS